jgi:hypothetical protein
MKRIPILLLAAMTALLFSCNDKTSGEKYSLKPNLKPGESYGLEYKIEMDQDVMGMNNNITMNMGYQMKVRDISPQHDINLDFMYNHIGMSMRSKLMNFSYDSDSSAAPQAGEKDESATGGLASKMKDMYGKIMGALVKKPMQITLDEFGKVKTVSGYKEMITSLKDSLSTMTPGKDDALDNLMDEAQIRQVFQQTFGTFPQKPVSIGEKWSNEFSQNQSGMPMKFSNTYKLVDVLAKENEAIIDITSTITTGDNSEITKNGMSVKMDMNGTQTGKMTVDLGTGMVKSGKINQEIKVNMEMMGQKIPMTMKGTATMVGKKM